jgi:hypothetical protein
MGVGVSSARTSATMPRLAAGALLVLAVTTAACAGVDDETAATEAALAAIGAGDKPWEVTSEKGESLLPNLFYAEATENEQVMPTTIGGRYAIDRMVYPTIGNPKLYVKEDARDTLTVVLRIEEDVLAHLAPDMSKSLPGSPLNVLTLREDAMNQVTFSLIGRAGRRHTNADFAIPPVNDVIRVRPTAMLVHPIPNDMPEAFKRRRTVRVVFDKRAMQGVPDGLYDLRFEVKKNGAVFERPGIGNTKVYEYQYNAVRVFDRAPPNDEYTALNVTDTQTSVGLLYQRFNTTQLRQFVSSVNTSQDPAVRRASFITFNGDLHNGGSPGCFLQRCVAVDYNDEAKVVVDALKDLTIPIFLTPGNHDGYASTGVAPSWVVTMDSFMFESLKEVVEERRPAWPGFKWEDYERYLKSLENQPGGFHRDIFVGSHIRRENAQSFSQGWIPVPREQRNMVLYDGFHQWQRTYGPLYTSFTFGRTRYLNLNTFDLRQHKRMGWGMFITNYGGGMSQLQLSWMNRELDRSKKDNQDVVVLAHHDPRGGNKGKDFGYYDEQLEFEGIGQSIFRFAAAQAIEPVICKAPSWALPHAVEEDCMHDGHSEWMRADEEFDCTDKERKPDGRCDVSKFDTRLPEAQRRHPLFSGYDFVHKLASNPNVRTLILGHVHYNSLEVAQSGDELVPDNVALKQLNERLATQLAAHEVQNPVRGHAWQQRATEGRIGDYDPERVRADGITEQNGHFFMLLEAASHGFNRVLSGDKRELVILRTTSNADMTSQNFNGDDGNGYAVLHISKKQDARNYGLPQINRVTFVINGGNGRFAQSRNVDIDRTARLTLKAPNNPVTKMFEGGPSK